MNSDKKDIRINISLQQNNREYQTELKDTKNNEMFGNTLSNID